MKNLIEGLRDLWNEYERRLRMLQYNEDGVTRARKRIHDLSLFMIQKKYDVYSDSVGEEFLAEIKKTVTRKRAVSDYRVTISRINSCNTDAFWAEKFCIKNYEIKNKGLLALTDKLLEMLKVRGYKEEDSWRSRAEMTIECIKQLDIYMIENDILNYTCNVGNEFVETIRLVTDKNFRTYNDIYVLNIKRINLILSGSPAVLQSPKEYVIRNSAIRDGLSELLTRYRERGFSKYVNDVTRRVIQQLDYYMLCLGIDEYTEAVGESFSSWYDLRLTEDDRRLKYHYSAINHFNDAFFKRDFRYHHFGSEIYIPDAFKLALEMFISECKTNGNKESTLRKKVFMCSKLFQALERSDCGCIKDINVNVILQCNKILTVSYKSSSKLFLKFCYDHGLIDKDYSFYITQRRRKLSLPTFYTKEEREKLESVCDRSTIVGKRDYAILLIIIHLGLRSSDVAHLKLSNIETKSGRISFQQYKTGNPQTLPLIKKIEDAIKDYMDSTQTRDDKQEIFRTIRPPFGPLTSTDIYGIVSRALAKAGIDTEGRKRGGHALRSSLLTSMINTGVTYEEARYVLGHRDDNSIKHYATLDIQHLRLCASDVPKPSGNFEKLLGQHC